MCLPRSEMERSKRLPTLGTLRICERQSVTGLPSEAAEFAQKVLGVDA